MTLRGRLILATMLVLFAAGAGGWYALRPPLSFLIAPEATAVQIRQTGLGEQVVVYDAPGPAYAWRSWVVSELNAHGWSVTVETNGEYPIFNYSRLSTFVFVATLDRVDIDGGPNTARITVRRWINLPCLQLAPSPGWAWNTGWTCAS